MRRYTPCLALLVLLLAAQSPVPAQSEDTLIRATVRRVLGPQAFTLDYRPGVDGELIVLAPGAEATPVPGTTVLVGGMLRQPGEAERTNAPAWNEIDERTRETLAGRPMLVASSLRTAAGRQLMAGALPGRTARLPLRQAPLEATREPIQTRVHAGALAQLIDELGGRPIRLPRARVLVVLNPRVFLIESAMSLPAIVGNLERVLVLVDAGALRVDAASLVGSNVTVLGTARTLLGLQVTGEVPWPPVLTREVAERFEIRAAVLATSVQTSDGVELTNRP